MRHAVPGAREVAARRGVQGARLALAVAVGLVALVAMTLLALTHLSMQTIVTIALALALLAFGVVREG